MRQPTIHQMREESFIKERSRKSKRFNTYHGLHKNSKPTKPHIQGVSAKIFEPNSSVIFQRIFVKFKKNADILDGEE
jgi:hypothetical protein